MVKSIQRISTVVVHRAYDPINAGHVNTFSVLPMIEKQQKMNQKKRTFSKVIITPPPTPTPTTATAIELAVQAV